MSNKLSSQTKLQSIFETITQIMTGYMINVCMYMVILPLFGFNVTLTQSFQVSALFTVISLVRLYVIRRLFNNWSGK